MNAYTWPDGTPKSMNNAFTSMPPVGRELSYDEQKEEARRAKVREKSRLRRERLKKDPFSFVSPEERVLRVNPTSNIAKSHGPVQSYRNR